MANREVIPMLSGISGKGKTPGGRGQVIGGLPRIVILTPKCLHSLSIRKVEALQVHQRDLSLDCTVL